jgi:hypothetical protein
MISHLQKEEAVYEQNKNSLLEAGKGRYVVIKGDEILSFFDSEEEALKEGYKRFNPNEPFLVKKVLSSENLHFFSPSPLHYGIDNE